MRLSDLSVRALPVPQHGQKMHWDDTLKGFGVRVSQGGTRTFVLMHGRARTLTTIGKVGVISLKDARGEARRILAERTLGRLSERSDISFEEAVDKFLETHEGKQSTKDAYHGLFKRHFLPKFRLERLDRIRTSDITRIIDKLANRHAEASHAHAAMAALLNWARSRRFIEHSPLEGVKKPYQGQAKDRVLTDEEIITIFAVNDPPPMGLILQLILLTGQRPGQIGALHADYIGQDRITWPVEAMKWQRKHANRQHIIPITPMTADILSRLPKRGFLFPTGKGAPYSNWSNGKSAFDALTGLSGYTCHDCRRTTATKMGDLEVLPHIIDVLQAHRFQGSSGHLGSAFHL
jgi:integrase